MSTVQVTKNHVTNIDLLWKCRLCSWPPKWIHNISALGRAVYNVFTPGTLLHFVYVHMRFTPNKPYLYFDMVQLSDTNTMQYSSCRCVQVARKTQLHFVLVCLRSILNKPLFTLICVHTRCSLCTLWSGYTSPCSSTIQHCTDLYMLLERQHCTLWLYVNKWAILNTSLLYFDLHTYTMYTFNAQTKWRPSIQWWDEQEYVPW